MVLDVPNRRIDRNEVSLGCVIPLPSLIVFMCYVMHYFFQIVPMHVRLAVAKQNYKLKPFRLGKVMAP